jgi:ribokinase
VAVENGTGENLIVVAPGANGELAPADVRVDAVRCAPVVLLQLEVPMATVAAAVRHASGCVVLNPAPTTTLPADVLDRVDVLVPNEWELRRLAGGPATEEPVERLAEIARGVGARNVVVTLGGRGALVVPRDGEPRHITPPEVNPVDTTGAGDCFCGALSVALAHGSCLVAATEFAVAAAALSTTAAGARGYLPDRAAVEAVLARVRG